jgi:hypothetical protein
MFRHHSSRTLHFSSLVVTFLILSLRTRDLQRKVACASAGSWFHSLIVLFTKEYLPISVCYPTFRDNVVVSSIRNVCTLSLFSEPSTLQDETGAFSWHVWHTSPRNAAPCPKRNKTSAAPLRKPNTSHESSSSNLPNVLLLTDSVTARQNFVL